MYVIVGSFHVILHIQFITIMKHANIYIQSVPGKCAIIRENVPYVKVHRYNPKQLYPKLNVYGDNGERSLKV